MGVSEKCLKTLKNSGTSDQKHIIAITMVENPKLEVPQEGKFLRDLPRRTVQAHVCFLVCVFLFPLFNTKDILNQ